MDGLSQRLLMGAASKKKDILLVGNPSTSASGTSITISTSGILSGDLIVAVCCSTTTATWTDSHSFTEVLDQAAAPSIRVAYKIAGGSEPASYTFTASATGELAGVVLVLRYAAWDAVGTVSTTQTSNVQTAPAITVGANRSSLFAFFTNTGVVTWSSPTTGLVSVASYSKTPAPSFELFLDDLVASGSSGTKSATLSSAGGSMGAVLFSVKPA